GLVFLLRGSSEIAAHSARHTDQNVERRATVKLRRLAASCLFSVAIGASFVTAAQQPTGLDPRIGPPVRGKYEGVQDAKDWLNPYLSICPQGVDLTVAAVGRKSLVSVPALRAELVKLPLGAWPYGRIVAVQECSIGVPGDEQARRQRLAAVE